MRTATIVSVLAAAQAIGFFCVTDSKATCQKPSIQSCIPYITEGERATYTDIEALESMKHAVHYPETGKVEIKELKSSGITGGTVIINGVEVSNEPTLQVTTTYTRSTNVYDNCADVLGDFVNVVKFSDVCTAESTANACKLTDNGFTYGGADDGDNAASVSVAAAVVAAAAIAMRA